MEDKMTIDQVLAVTIDILESIDVPMKKLNEIGVPIQKAIGNMRLCIQALQESMAQQEQAEAAFPEAECEEMIIEPGK